MKDPLRSQGSFRDHRQENRRKRRSYEENIPRVEIDCHKSVVALALRPLFEISTRVKMTTKLCNTGITAEIIALSSRNLQ